jgi:hypothetical protein
LGGVNRVEGLNETEALAALSVESHNNHQSTSIESPVNVEIPSLVYQAIRYRYSGCVVARGQKKGRTKFLEVAQRIPQEEQCGCEG